MIPRDSWLVETAENTESVIGVGFEWTVDTAGPTFKHFVWLNSHCHSQLQKKQHDDAIHFIHVPTEANRLYEITF